MDGQVHIPAGLAVLLIAGAFLVARLWPPASGFMAALRSVVWRHARFPRLRVLPPPPPVDENGEPAPGTALPTDPANPGGGSMGGMG